MNWEYRSDLLIATCRVSPIGNQYCCENKHNITQRKVYIKRNTSTLFAKDEGKVNR